MFSPSTILEVKATGYDMSWIPSPAPGIEISPAIMTPATGVTSRNLYFWSHWFSSRLGGTASAFHERRQPHPGNARFQNSASNSRGVPAGGATTSTAQTRLFTMISTASPTWRKSSSYSRTPSTPAFPFTRRTPGRSPTIWSLTRTPVQCLQGSIPPLTSGDTTVYKPTGFEPRIGLVWDILRNHKTLLKAHYGRYFEGTKTYNFAQMTPMFGRHLLCRRAGFGAP